MASLQSCLNESPLSENTKHHIANTFWASSSSQSHELLVEPDLRAYWAYYTDTCGYSLHDAGRHISVRTHQDVLDIAHQINDGVHRDTIKVGLLSTVSSLDPDQCGALVESSIDLAAQLLLMTDFGTLQYGFSGRGQLHWQKGPLQDLLTAHFSNTPSLCHDGVKLDRIFNARSLHRIAGLEIVWTRNLADHLRLMDDDRKVAVFSNASFLGYQLKSSLLPEGLAEETLRTLTLLFPQTDRDTQKWLSKTVAALDIDRRLLYRGHLKTDDRQIQKFVFWRDRLIMLKQVFDEARPNSFLQWWYDRRNGVQWYTFWVAVFVLLLTIFFGLIQSVEGALQVYASFHHP